MPKFRITVLRRTISEENGTLEIELPNVDGIAQAVHEADGIRWDKEELVDATREILDIKEVG